MVLFMKRKTKRSVKPRGGKSKARASWRGALSFGLVSFPVQAFNAHLPAEDHVAFHQLHEKCHSRIHYEKVCPLHGQVDQSEIVSGFEYKKGKYVEIEPEELEALRTTKEKALTIDSFIEPAELDPIYFDGRMYLLAPDGPEATEPYAVFLAALEHTEKVGIGQVVMSGKDQAVLLRPYDGALQMALLNYEHEMRSADDVVGDLPTLKATDRKVKLAEQLIASWETKSFDFSNYEDRYFEKVKELIDAKVKGREVVAPEEEEEPSVVNLMDALKKSVARSGVRATTLHMPAAASKKRRPKKRAAARRKRAS